VTPCRCASCSRCCRRPKCLQIQVQAVVLHPVTLNTKALRSSQVSTPATHPRRSPVRTPRIGRNVRLQFWNPSVHYNVRKRTPLDPVLSQMNPLRTITPCVFKVSEVLPPSVLRASPTGCFFHHFPERDSGHGTQRPQV
jgi:hypothetical protein